MALKENLFVVTNDTQGPRYYYSIEIFLETFQSIKDFKYYKTYIISLKVLRSSYVAELFQGAVFLESNVTT